MILPKKMLNQISYYEYNHVIDSPGKPIDKFTLHFKSFWKKKKIIKINRRIFNQEGNGNYSHSMTDEGEEFLNQLKEYIESTYDEDVRDRYDADPGTNIITLKPRD